MIAKIIEILPINIVSCQEATRLASLAMERRLSLKERFDLQMHLWVCRLCVNFVKQIHGLRNLLGHYTPQGEKQLPQQIKNQIKAALKTQS